MNKVSAIQAKKGRKAKAVVRAVTDVSAPAAPAKVEVVSSPAGVSVTSVAPGFKNLNKGGYRAYLPGPGAKQHKNPFGVAPEISTQFYR